MNRLIAKKMLKPLSIIGLAALYAGQVHAACAPFDNDPFQHPITIANPIPVKQSTPVGAVVGRYSNTGTGETVLLCTGSATPVRFQSAYVNSVSALPGVYATSVPGVGVTVKYKGAELLGDELELGYDNVLKVFPSNVRTTNRAGDVIVEFVRIPGDVVAGSWPVGLIGRTNVVTTLGSQRYREISISNVVIRVPTCSLTAGSLRQTVPLGTWNTSDFGGVGSGTRWEGFRFVSQECDTSQFSRVGMTFSAAADSTNTNLFRVNGGATGVGIEVRTENDALVAPGATVNMQPLAAGGEYRFKARYTRTAAALDGGQANASVTVSVNYE